MASSTTAQSVPPNMAACQTCILSASIKQSPSCDGLQNQAPPTSGVLTDKQKSCYCGLASSDAWIKPCEGATTCDSTTVSMILQTYATMKATACTAGTGGNGAGPGPANPSASSGVTPPTTTSQTGKNDAVTMGSSKVAAGMVAVAVVAALF
ncbi:hypothetical protein BGX23_007281 [Mortierella sp. AD031]|nr:hypothetical protein BGX23_007281 [Mortierella sp. AD031]